MKKAKRMKSLFAAFFALVLVTTSVFAYNTYRANAADETTIKVTTNVTEAKAGEKVVATVTRDLVAFKDAFIIEGPEEEMPFLVALVATMEGLIDKKKQDAKL